MSFLRKLFSLGFSGLKKVLFLIRERLDLVEVKVLFIGLLLTVMLGVYLLTLLFIDPHQYKILFSTAVVHTMGGRALGIITCLSADISKFYTIVYNFYLEVVIVLLVYAVVVLIMRNIIQPKLFQNAVRQAEMTAQSQKTKIKKYGAIGLFIFVMLPFFMTGPVIGSLIGYLMNYRAINNFLIVFSGTLASIVLYTLVGDNLVRFVEQFAYIDQIKKWGSIAIGVMIVIFVVYHLKTVKKFLDSQDDDE